MTYTATTYLKSHHISSGKTIRESMQDRFDYGQNPYKTQDGDLILSYECDPETADAEFLLSKAKYKAITGREQKRDEDVLCYQIRQAFPPGELDAEAALQTSYELAMRWTKGNHAFFVVSHVDRPHPHCHIYYNSTSLDCARKFRDFLGSGRALRRLSDRVCIEHGLSVITNPKLHSQGKFKHYGDWLNAGGKQPTYLEQLRTVIDAALAKQPANFAAFLSYMEAAGYTVKHGRSGSISFLAPGQKRPTRLRASTLGEGYGPEEIQAAISGSRRITEATDRKVNLIVDIQAKLREGKGPGYERWAKVFNLKQLAAALAYLQENNLLEYAQLEEKAEAAGQFHALMDEIKTIEAALTVNRELKAATVKYAKTRPVFEAYKAAGYSRKFLAEHEAELAIYRAARTDFQRLLNGAKLPKMDKLKEEGRKLTDRKKALYADYQEVKRDMQEVLAAKANIDYLLGYDGQEKNKKQER